MWSPVLTFLSHAAPERECIGLIARRLKERHGQDTWYAPRDCPPGKAWVESIVDGLDRSAAIVVLLSPTSVRSKWVDREVHHAIQRNKIVIPIVLGDTQLSNRTRFFLDPLHQMSLPDMSQSAVDDLVDQLAAQLDVVAAQVDGPEDDPNVAPVASGVIETEAPPPLPTITKVSQATPAYFIFLVDCSHSMSNRLTPNGLQKRDIVAMTINRVIYRLARESVDDESAYSHYFDVSVIGYGLGSNGQDTESMLIEDGQQIDRMSIPQLMRMETRVMDVPLARRGGGEGHRTFRQPVWVEPRSHVLGRTVMATGFRKAADLAKEWITEHPDSIAPMVLNITDGQWTGESPVDAARTLEEVTTRVGNVAVFNCQLGRAGADGNMRKLMFPSELPPEVVDPKTTDIFSLSSELSEAMLQEAGERNYDVAEKARGYVLNGDVAQLVDFLNIGTRTSV